MVEALVSDNVKCFWTVPKGEVLLSKKDKKLGNLFSLVFPEHPVFGIEVNGVEVFSVNFSNEESLMEFITYNEGNNIFNSGCEDIICSLEVDDHFLQAVECFDNECLETIISWLESNNYKVWVEDSGSIFPNKNIPIIIGNYLPPKFESFSQIEDLEEAARILYELDDNYPIIYSF